MLIIAIISFIPGWGCAEQPDPSEKEFEKLLAQYEEVVLTADLSHLSDAEKELIPILMEAAQHIDELFWLQTYGWPREHVLNQMSSETARRYALINYGPWSRLAGHTAFYPGFDDKPLGAQFYPEDMSREEFDAWDHPLKSHPYTLVRRDQQGELYVIPYREAFQEQLSAISELLTRAAQTADYEKMSVFFKELANDLKNDNLEASEYAWMQMQNHNLDLVMRPLDTGEDRKFGYKASYSSYILVKEPQWTARLERFSDLAGQLQQKLPVPQSYRQTSQEQRAEIFVYDALYYAGHCNAGPKIIALYLPRTPEVIEQTGTRSMQLKNVMEAKFDHILKPIGQMMIHESQREMVSSDAFFMLTAFHEIAASQGISRLIDGSGTVRQALREHFNTIDATSTDLMALYMIAALADMGEISQEELYQAYITSFASVMRSSRFGAAGAHGIAGMIRFNMFERENVFTRCPETLTYQVDVENMKSAIEKALAQLIIMQGDGDYHAAGELINRDGSMPGYFREDIDRINNAGIPVDVYFRQGLEHLGI